MPSLPGANVRLVRFVRRHATGLVATTIGTVLAAALITDGTFRLTSSPEHKLNGYYDALGESLLQGRFDVPPEAIGDEAFLIDGRAYGYFGPTPAILRLPLNRLFPTMRGHWTRLSMLAACALTLFAVDLVLRHARRDLRRDDVSDTDSLAGRLVEGAFVVGALVGPPMLFIVREAIIYHEAAIWGAAFALWSYVAILAYCERNRFAFLASAVVFAAASAQARGSVGLGSIAAILLLSAWMLFRARASRRVRHGLTAALAAALVAGGTYYKNMAVFGAASGIPPLILHVQIRYDEARLAQTDGGHFIQPRNVRTALYNYFHPLQFYRKKSFPFIESLRRGDVHRFPETRLDWSAPFASFTTVNPIWLALTALGLVFLVRPRLAGATLRSEGFPIALVGAAVGAGSILIVACIAQRYLHDAFPMWILASAVGLQGLALIAARSARMRIFAPLLVLLAIYTCYANAAVSLTIPRPGEAAGERRGITPFSLR